MSNQDKKTILYLITQSEWGGAQRYVFDLAKSLKGEYNVLVAFGEQGESGELAEKLKSENIKFFTLKNLKRSIIPAADLLSLLEIRKLIKKIKPEIVHLNSSKVSILGSLACVFLKSKVIYTAHGWVFNEPLPNWQKLFYKYAEKITALRKDKIICVSNFDYNLALTERITSSKKIIAINNGIADTNLLERQAAREKLQSNKNNILFNIKDDDIVIGSIGNLYRTKGYEFLINAAKIMENYKKNLKFIIVGDGSEKQELASLIKQLNLSSSVLLAGRINDSAKLLKAFDIYICSSVKEGLSYTIIEAMSAGLPIIATKVGGNEELITDNQEGLIIRPANSEELAKAIIKLLNDSDLAKRFGVAAQLKSKNYFTEEKMIQQTKALYN